ncbi:MAG: leucine-rich repeat domain-containing protein [Synergistaceae bacterium]|nr:leucine-rich repeat domain-containing protein [Synergistaceae bacterium]
MFAGSRSLKSITIPGSMTYIAHGAFSRIGSLTGAVIPEGVESVGASAFQGCVSLMSVDMTSAVRLRLRYRGRRLSEGRSARLTKSATARFLTASPWLA